MGFIERFRSARAARVATERRAQADANAKFLETLQRLNDISGGLKHPSVEAALKFPAVSAAVALLSRELAKLPIIVYKRDKGFKEEAPDDPYAYILSERWTPQETAFAAAERFWYNVFTAGMGYAVIRKVGRRLEALQVISPYRIHRTWTGHRMIYQVTETGEYIPRENMIEVAWRYKRYAFSYGQEYSGKDYVSPIEHGWEAIRSGLLALRYSARHFGGGALPAAVIQTSASTEKTLKNIAKDLNSALRRMHREEQLILPLPAAISDVKTLSINPQESELATQRRVAVEEIARLFGIPPAQLQELTRGTYRNTEQSARTLAQQSLSPWAIKWGDEATDRLYGPTRRNMFVGMDIRAMLRGDFRTEAEATVKLTGGPLMTPNEGRRRFDLPPVDGGNSLVKMPGQPDGDGDTDPPEPEPDDPDLPDPDDLDPEEDPDSEDEDDEA